VPLEYRPDLKIVEGPFYPEWVTVDRDGLVFANIKRAAQEVPTRFHGAPRPGDDDGLPWETMSCAPLSSSLTFRSMAV
jgi:hypothetical protein